MLVDVVGEFAAEVLRPAAAEANETCAAPESVLKASLDIGLPILGVPEALGGISEERSAMAGTLVAEALAHGDMGLAVATLAPGAVATALVPVGHGRAAADLPSGVHRGRRPGGRAGAGRADGAVRPARRRPPGATATATATRSTASSRRWSAAPRPSSSSSARARRGARPVPRRVDRRWPRRSRRTRRWASAPPALTRLALTACAPAERARRGRRVVVRRVRAALAPRVVRAGGRHRTGGPRLRHAVRQRARGVRRADQPPPVGRVHGRQHRHRAAGDAAGHLEGRLAGRPGQGLRPRGGARPPLCTDKGMQIGLDGVQLLGGHGFVKEHPVERWYRDLRAIGIMEGGVLV